MSKKKNEVIISNSAESSLANFSSVGTGRFERGFDKKGRPYEKKMYDDGRYTKEERLLDGTPKITIKPSKTK